MEQLFKIVLWIHIAGGATGLLTGTINVIRRKGDKMHKRAGKFFLYSMLITGFAALVLTVIHPNYFLFIIGVFTIYMAASGERYLHLKQLAKGQRPKAVDWVLTYSMLAFGLGFIGFGIYHLVNKNSFGIVFIVFGFIALRFVQKDMNHFKGKIKEKNYWLLAHLQRMIGAYIAAITAFLVVNSLVFPQVIPGFVFWLLPTVILTPLIFKWSKEFAVSVK